MKIKSKEVAEALGVSTATVSLAINGKAGVNEETRQRILEYIGGKQGKSSAGENFVKLVCFENSPRLMEGEMRGLFRITYVESARRLQKEGIEVRLVYAYGRDELREVFEKSKTDGTRGILLRADESEAVDWELVSQCRIPLVLNDCEAWQTCWNAVNFNNRLAVFQGMDYLKMHGCRNVVYFQNTASLYNFKRRREAFKEYLQTDCDITGKFVEVGSELGEIEESTAKYLKSVESYPDAVFMENFMVSIGTAQSLIKMGVSVPEQISLIGIDSLPDTVLLPYELTHFEVPHKKRSILTAQLLLERMDNPADEYGQEILVNEKLIEGNSVKAYGK